MKKTLTQRLEEAVSILQSNGAEANLLQEEDSKILEVKVDSPAELTEKLESVIHLFEYSPDDKEDKEMCLSYATKFELKYELVD